MHGRAIRSRIVAGMPTTSVRETLRDGASRVLDSSRRNDVVGLAAEVAYRFLLAVAPFALVVAAMGAFIGDVLHVKNPVAEIVATLEHSLAPAVADVVRPELQFLVATPRADLLGIGVVLALLTATGGTNALIKGIHRAYDIPERRPFLLRYAVALGLTILETVGVIACFALVLGGTVATNQAASQAGEGSAASVFLQLIRWPVVFVILTAAVALLYRYGPNVIVPWRWIVVGSAAFAAGWLIATAVLGLYTSIAGALGASYGSITGVIVIMLWVYATSALLLLGAELSATLARERSPNVIRSRHEEDHARRAVHRATHT
jgi:membrane protein